MEGAGAAAVLLALGAAAAGPAPAARSPTRHLVEIRGMAFHPADLTVERGDTVVWINRDILVHSATAKGAGPLRWDTGMIGPDSSRRYVARRRGRVSYICALHPVMKGTLTIR